MGGGRVALVFAETLLQRFDPALLHRAVLYWTRRKGDLEKLQQLLPRPATHKGALEFAFFLDGNEDLAEQDDSAWPMILLPGGASPDDLFRALAPERASSLASSLRTTDDVVAAVLGKVEGLDPHDWTNDFALHSRGDRPAALRALANATLDTDRGTELLEEFRLNLVASGLRFFSGLE
jgi:hypothetical protein